MRRRSLRIARATVRTRPDLPSALEPFSAGRSGAARSWRPAGLLAALLLLGCAQGPAPPATPAEEARHALAEGRTAGAIRTVVRGNPFGMNEGRRDALVTTAMAEGVPGLKVRFTTSPDQAAAPEPHLVVVLNPAGESPAAACRPPDTLSTLPADDQLSVLAAFCRGDEVLNSVREEGRVASPTDRGFERLLWRTSAALFPDDYWDNYGFGFLSRDIDLGIGGSFGF
jgi:hypothetical protein